MRPQWPAPTSSAWESTSAWSPWKAHLVAHLARANCLVVVPEDVTELAAGAEVDVVLIEGALR